MKQIDNKVIQAENREINRSEINLASYNPRIITEEARKKLKQNLKEKGLMGGIIWNEATKNLVGGHQRLSIIDSINRYKEGENDYKLRVEVVNLTDKEEKEQNIFLNNTNVQGEFDDNLLKSLLNDIDYEIAGLTDSDMLLLGVDIPTIELTNNDIEQQDFFNEVADNKKVIETEKKILKQDEKYLNDGEIDNYAKRQDMLKQRKEDNGEYIDVLLILSFDNRTNKRAFLKRFDLGDTDRIKGEPFSEMIERVF